LMQMQITRRVCRKQQQQVGLLFLAALECVKIRPGGRQ
jgi:hypothetical protein